MSVSTEQLIEVEKYGVKYTFVKKQENENWLNDWLINQFKAWEDDTFRDFMKCTGRKSANKVALDLGGWIGTTCIWLANHFKSVYVVEADPISLRQLRDNITASGVSDNTIVVDRPVALDDRVVFFGPHKTERFLNQSLNTSMSQMKKERKNLSLGCRNKIYSAD